MKIIILSLIPFLSLSQDNINGIWIKEGNKYKYILKINHLDSNTYEFELEGWEKTYDNFINDSTIFTGEIKGEGYIFYREKRLGFFNDAGRLFDGEAFIMVKSRARYSLCLNKVTLNLQVWIVQVGMEAMVLTGMVNI